MRLDKKSAGEMAPSTVSQAYFARLVGCCPMRISQLVKSGALNSSEDGMKLIPNLQRYYGMKLARRQGYSTAEFLRYWAE